MSGSSTTRKEHRFLRPGVFFPSLVLLVTVSVLLTPRAAPDLAPSLSTHSFGPGGAAGLSDIAERFGWRVRTIEEPLSPSMTEDAVYAVLVRGGTLTASETHILLDRVRQGASLLILLGGGPLRDSLRMDVGEWQSRLLRGDDSVACPQEPFTVRTLQRRVPLFANEIEYIGPPVGDTIHIAAIGSSRTRRATVLGVRLGKGRVAVSAGGDLFTNESIRACNWGAGIVAIRTLEWLRARDGGPPRREIVFDEFHHGYGSHASVMRTLGRWAKGTPSGRTTLQIAIAALVLLVSAAPRPIAPLPAPTIARRSPLEHVSALASAYEKVRGTRIGTRLLVKGVRRRANRPVGTHAATEEQFLDTLVERSPSLAGDAARVKAAMRSQISPAEFLEIAGIIDRIERSVRT
jgi:hypothetical protein